MKPNKICKNCLEYQGAPVTEEIRIDDGICECCKRVKITWVRREEVVE